MNAAEVDPSLLAAFGNPPQFESIEFHKTLNFLSIHLHSDRRDIRAIALFYRNEKKEWHVPFFRCLRPLDLSVCLEEHAAEIGRFNQITSNESKIEVKFYLDLACEFATIDPAVTEALRKTGFVVDPQNSRRLVYCHQLGRVNMMDLDILRRKLWCKIRCLSRYSF